MKTCTYDSVTSSLDEDGLRSLLLNRPQRLNAMNRQLLRDVTRAFDDANADQATRVILFSGVAWRVVGDVELMESARATGHRLARLPQRSVLAMKRVLRHTSSADFAAALRLESAATVDGFMDPLTTSLLKDF